MAIPWRETLISNVLRFCDIFVRHYLYFLQQVLDSRTFSDAVKKDHVIYELFIIDAGTLYLKYPLSSTQALTFRKIYFICFNKSPLKIMKNASYSI